MLKHGAVAHASSIVSKPSVQPRPCSLVKSRSNSRRVSPLVCASSSSPATNVTETRTATVQVDLGYAAEQAVVTLTQPKSRLVEATMQFPLGLVLESEYTLLLCQFGQRDPDVPCLHPACTTCCNIGWETPFCTASADWCLPASESCCSSRADRSHGCSVVCTDVQGEVVVTEVSEGSAAAEANVRGEEGTFVVMAAT